MAIKIGDTLRLRPMICGCKSEELTAPQTVPVVYVHPEGRFYTVEFTNSLGWKFRECFQCRH